MSSLHYHHSIILIKTAKKYYYYLNFFFTKFKKIQVCIRVLWQSHQKLFFFLCGKVCVSIQEGAVTRSCCSDQQKKNHKEEEEAGASGETQQGLSAVCVLGLD